MAIFAHIVETKAVCLYFFADTFPNEPIDFIDAKHISNFDLVRNIFKTTSMSYTKIPFSIENDLINIIDADENSPNI